MFAAHQLSTAPNQVTPGNVKAIKRKTVVAGATTTLCVIPIKPGRLVYIEAAIKCRSTAGAMGLFLLKAAARNAAGTTSLLGTANLVSFRDGTEVSVAVVADDTADALVIQGVAATATNTDFTGQVQITDTANRVNE